VLQPFALGKHLPENFKNLHHHIPQNKEIAKFDGLRFVLPINCSFKRYK
jgi:hypothetical protein